MGQPIRIVHRDVNKIPYWLYLQGALIDFGIANTSHVSQTQVGILKGKYAYMSPEQVLGGGGSSVRCSPPVWCSLNF